MRRLIAALAGALLLTLGVALPAFATGSPPPNTNEVAYWCPNGGVKIDGNGSSTTFTVPAPPANISSWTLLVIKAGSDQSVENENETFPNPVVGQTYSHSSGKVISHVILCYGPPSSTTTGASTTLATTTVATTIATTTTAGTTTSVGTVPQCVPFPECSTTTTGGTTTTTATTLPTTTTTAGGSTTTAGTTTTTGGTTTTVVNTTQETVGSTTTVAKTTTTPAPTTTVPATTTTVPIPPPSDDFVVTTTPTELPHTGSNEAQLALIGVGLVLMGGAGVATARRR